MSKLERQETGSEGFDLLAFFQSKPLTTKPLTPEQKSKRERGMREVAAGERAPIDSDPIAAVLLRSR